MIVPEGRSDLNGKRDAVCEVVSQNLLNQEGEQTSDGFGSRVTLLDPAHSFEQIVFEVVRQVQLRQRLFEVDRGGLRQIRRPAVDWVWGGG